MGQGADLRFYCPFWPLNSLLLLVDSGETGAEAGNKVFNHFSIENQADVLEKGSFGIPNSDPGSGIGTIGKGSSSISLKFDEGLNPPGFWLLLAGYGIFGEGVGWEVDGFAGEIFGFAQG